MGKKKFIDKRKSATFQLLARDSSSTTSAAAAAGPPPGDRVFVRVDNNPYHCPIQFEDDDANAAQGGEIEEEGDPNCIFADAPGDTDGEDDASACPSPPVWIAGSHSQNRGGPLPHHVRKEILELGLPDDGYNYLLHLREITNAGGGSSYYHNSKAKLDRLPLDVKAYDASRVKISSEVADDEEKEDSIYAVASKMVSVKVQKAVDPDVARLLDDNDFSRYGSDVEDLDEDFVIKANLPEEKQDEEEEGGDQRVERHNGAASLSRHVVAPRCLESEAEEEDGDDDFLRGDEKPRTRRFLDEQFDLLTRREYDNDSDNDDGGYMDSDDRALAAKLNGALKEYGMNELELEDKYKVPADFVRGQKGSNRGAEMDISADVIRRCVEYADKYCDENLNDEEVVIVQESSDESEVWDCETIVSTYSNLDNHPGKIQAPENLKQKIPKNLPGDSIIKSNVIELRGKEKLPVDFLPHNRRPVGKVKAVVSSGVDKLKRRTHGEESKEEKKERKAAVKGERREARRAKKKLKGLYRCETQKAQKVAAVSGPSSIHLM